MHNIPDIQLKLGGNRDIEIHDGIDGGGAKQSARSQ